MHVLRLLCMPSPEIPRPLNFFGRKLVQLPGQCMLRRFRSCALPAKALRFLVSMDITADFKSFQEKVQRSLVNVTKTAGQLSAEDLSFHRSSSGKLSKSLDAQNARLLQLTNKLLKAATKDTQIAPPKLRNQEEVEDKWRSTVDVIDDLLEKYDACLD